MVDVAGMIKGEGQGGEVQGRWSKGCRAEEDVTAAGEEGVVGGGEVGPANGIKNEVKTW